MIFQYKFKIIKISGAKIFDLRRQKSKCSMDNTALKSKQSSNIQMYAIGELLEIHKC